MQKDLNNLTCFQVESESDALLPRVQHPAELLQTVNHSRRRQEAREEIGLPQVLRGSL
jgi:hypothetical protein